jgi:hypothetical protein
MKLSAHRSIKSLTVDPCSIPPRSITAIGNDQLISLEVAATALADAGYGDRPFDRERTSVVFGAETGTDLAQAYGFRAALPHFVGHVPETLAGLPELTEDSFPGVLPHVRRGGRRHLVGRGCRLRRAQAAGRRRARWRPHPRRHRVGRGVE